MMRKRPVREFEQTYSNPRRTPYIESGEIVERQEFREDREDRRGQETSFRGGFRGGYRGGRGGRGGFGTGSFYESMPAPLIPHTPTQMSMPGISGIGHTQVQIPEYTMVIRKTIHGWQFLASIEDSPYWFLPKTNKESYVMACRDITPTIVTFMHDRMKQQAAVYIVTDENARAPWRSVQKPARRSIVPLRDWIYFSEVFIHLDKHAVSSSSSTSSSSTTPMVWNRLVHRSMVHILQDILIRFLGLEEMPRDRPMVLYHGTSLDAVKHILTKGFEVLPCKCDGGDLETTEVKSNKDTAATSMFDFREDTETFRNWCTCRMMGKGVYGCSFFRASKFAQAKFGRKACVLRFVVHKSVHFYTVQKEDTCACPCAQSYVDHCGKLIEKYGAVHLKNDSLPATTSPEWVIGDASKCFPINYIYFPPRVQVPDRKPQSVEERGREEEEEEEEIGSIYSENNSVTEKDRDILGNFMDF